MLAALLVAPISGAVAAPTSDSGPTAGGTSVSDVVTGVGFTQVDSAVSAQMAAVDAGGRAYTWGYNWKGQNGDGTTTMRTRPGLAKTPDGVAIRQVSAGNHHTLFLGANGQAYATGANDEGRLGNGTTTASTMPVAVTMPTGVHFTQLAAAFESSVALGSDGNAYQWGDRAIWNPTTKKYSNSLVPVKVAAPEGDPFTQISDVDSTVISITKSGAVYTWGGNGYGQAGVDFETPTQLPVRANTPEGLRFTQVSAGMQHTLALDVNGVAWAWGSNFNGELGNGTSGTGNQTKPAKVTMPAGVTFKQVSAGWDFSLGLATDGQLYGWGNNQDGVLGDGTTTDQPLPVKEHLPEGVSFTQADAGMRNAVAIGSDGITYTWGASQGGQLGNGSVDPNGRYVPGPIDSTLTVTQVLFGDVAGTDLSQKGNTWTVTSPAGCGVKDITVNYSQYGATHAAVTKNGFTQGTAPVVTVQPKGASVDKGGQVTVSAAATGDGVPTIQWQQSASADGGWADIDGATSDSTTVSPTGDTFVRAVFTNCVGTATTDVAKVAVNAVTPTPTPSPTPTPTPTPTVTPTPTPSASPSGGASSGAPSATVPGGAGEPSAGASSAPAGSQVSTSGTAGGPAAGVAGVVLVAAIGAAVAAGLQVKRRTRR